MQINGGNERITVGIQINMLCGIQQKGGLPDLLRIDGGVRIIDGHSGCQLQVIENIIGNDTFRYNALTKRLVYTNIFASKYEYIHSQMKRTGNTLIDENRLFASRLPERSKGMVKAFEEITRTGRCD